VVGNDVSLPRPNSSLHRGAEAAGRPHSRRRTPKPLLKSASMNGLLTTSGFSRGPTKADADLGRTWRALFAIIVSYLAAKPPLNQAEYTLSLRPF
jgi:hypothetical protein